MLDIAQELEQLLRTFEEKGLQYALCGGLAMAVHAEARAPYCIDMLIPEHEVEKAIAFSLERDFIRDATIPDFEKGGLRARKVFKRDNEDSAYLQVVFVSVTSLLESCWETREKWSLGNLHFWTLSQTGLDAMEDVVGKPGDTLAPPWGIRSGATDMSPVAIGCRLNRVAQLFTLCLSLSRAQRTDAPTDPAQPPLAPKSPNS